MSEQGWRAWVPRSVFGSWLSFICGACFASLDGLSFGRVLGIGLVMLPVALALDFVCFCLRKDAERAS